ncbi:MAG TPA: hypothetical protein VG501_07185, partial [Rhizomicrobium sp.]|nr:hypothetical protein [Rhizomicrobium sp.]
KEALDAAGILNPAPRQAVEVRAGSGAVAIAPLESPRRPGAQTNDGSEDKKADREEEERPDNGMGRDRSAVKRVGGRIVR